METVLSYIEAGKQEGARVVAGGGRAAVAGGKGYFVEPTIFDRVRPEMRIAQEEIFGPVLSVTPFRTVDEALAIANDTVYGLGAGVWTRNINRAYQLGRGIQAGRVWTNCYNLYPAHAAFGGYKQSGLGRENHLMMLNHYQQTKNMLVSYTESALGFF
jgi:aldehyde dehydrogenase